MQHNKPESLQKTREHSHSRTHRHEHGHGDNAVKYLSSFKTTTIFVMLLFISQRFVQLPPFLGAVIELMLVSIIIWLGRIFFVHAAHEIKARQYGMMTLVSLGIGAGYLFLVVNMFLGLDATANFALEIATLVWVLLLGHYLEAKAAGNAKGVLEKIAQLLPKKAHRILKYSSKLESSEIEDIDVAQLQVGDIVLVKAGEKVPADGTVIKGQAYVSEALVTGEAKPVVRGVNDRVYAGSICEDGGLIIKVDRVGADSTVGQIKRLVEQALATKPALQRLGDRISKYLTFFALGVALTSIAVWTLVLGKSLSFSIPLAVTVLVIACPHALGIGIPLVNNIATRLASKWGVFVKDLSKLEAANFVKYVVFDKTGTLTHGKPRVSQVLSFSKDLSEKEILKYAASLEQYVKHPIATSILAYAKKQGIPLLEVSNYKYYSGKGVRGVVSGNTYYAGSINFARASEGIAQKYAKQIQMIIAKSTTAVLLFSDDKLLGAILLEDTIKKNAAYVVRQLKDMQLIPVLLTGDNREAGLRVAKQIGIKKVFAEVKPHEKYRYIKNLQRGGAKVAMVGDGINDAAALTQADVGIAIGSGADIAVESGDIVLINSNLLNVLKFLKLARVVYRKMIENVFWALAYNVLAVPVAAGLFFPWGIKLSPRLGAMAMVFSDIIVSVNAMALNRYNFRIFKDEEN